MKLSTLVKVFIGLGVFLSLGSADAIEEICRPQNYRELVKCAENQSSEIQLSEQQLKTTTQLESVAGQWVNPELDAETVSKGSEKSESTVSLLFTFRLGGKRQALLDEARSEIQLAQAGRDLNVQQSRLNFMLAFYRLSHLKSEIRLEEESGETFSKIVRQFEKRPALSPEQSVSLSVFRLALSDHQLRLVKLKAEEGQIYKNLSAVTGLSSESISKNLPPKKQGWTEVGMVVGNESPQLKQAMAELKRAQSQKDKAESESWPDLKIGPTIKTVKEASESENFVGLSLSMPLPVFTLNGGGRAYASQKVIEAEMNLSQAKKKVVALREELANRYTQTVLVLKNNLSINEINEKHESIEKQFFKGLVPSSLVIEAHRQLFELEERRNASELEALASLGQLLILDNKFNEVIL